MNLSPTSPVGWMLLILRTRIDDARQNPDRGASAIEWVIITAIVVGLAAAVGWAVWNFVQDEKATIENPPELPGP